MKNHKEKRMTHRTQTGEEIVVTLPSDYQIECKCSLVHSCDDWRNLPNPAGGSFIHDMREIDDEEPTYHWEKNCTCGSTIAIDFDRNKKVYEE